MEERPLRYLQFYQLLHYFGTLNVIRGGGADMSETGGLKTNSARRVSSAQQQSRINEGCRETQTANPTGWTA